MFNYSKSVNKGFHFDDLFNIISNIPMKYTYLVFKNNIFELRYKFPYIETIINDNIEFSEVKNYFIENKDKDDFFHRKFKGDYFEYLAAEMIYEKKDILFNYHVKYALTVTDILSMGRYEDNNSNEMIIENNENSNNITKMKIKDYYDEKIKLLDKELQILNLPLLDINEDKKTINNFKYEEYSKEIELLRRKRKFNPNESAKNKSQKASEKGNEHLYNQNDNDVGDEIDENIKDLREEEIKLNEKNDLEKEINITNYKNDLINNGIIIKQKNECGKTIDIAVMLGDSSYKKFIGFQMKYYEEETDIENPEEFLKINLKDKMKKILVKCLEEFNIKVNEWHYFFCMYYNSNEKNGYNKALVNTCNKNDIEYIFFDPEKETFYARDLSPIKTEIQLTFRSNLDSFSSTNPYAIFKDNGVLEDFAIQRKGKSDIFFINDFIFNCKKSEIIKKLKDITNNEFENICKFAYNLKNPFPTPEKSYLFLFESKIENSCIYYYNRDNKNYICGELINNIKYDAYDAGLIPSYIKYEEKEKIPFYVLKIKEKN